MKECCEIFLLLPACSNCTQEEIFILPNYWVSTEYNEDKHNKDLQTLYDTINFLANDNCKIYYDKDNLKLFFNHTVDNNENAYPRNSKFQVARNIILKHCVYWKQNTCQEQGDIYNYEGYFSIENDMLCEIAKRVMLSEGNSNYLLCCDDILHQLHGNMVNIHLNGIKQSFDRLRFDLKEISIWISEKRIPQRIFNPNPKHGINSKGSYFTSKGNKVSKLECSVEEAEILLKKAICDDNSSKKILYFYDESRKKYIKFMCEINDQYHGFHLDKEEEDKIPKEIKNTIKIILSH